MIFHNYKNNKLLFE
jgi:sentrin-specific protease 1